MVWSGAVLVLVLLMAEGAVAQDQQGGPLVRQDPCVQQFPQVSSMVSEPPEDMSLLVSVLHAYCTHLPLLAAERVGGNQSCLDRVLAPQLRPVCNLTGTGRERCYQQVSTCQQMASAEVGAVYQEVAAATAGTHRPQPGMSLVSAVTLGQSVLTRACRRQRCLDAAAAECDVSTDDLSANIPGILRHISASIGSTPVVEVPPTSLHCCVSSAYHAAIFTCLPRTARRAIDSNRQLLEPVFGTRLVKLWSDALRDAQAILGEWGGEVSADNDTSGINAHREQQARLEDLINKLGTELQHENVTRDIMLTKLQDPMLIENLVREACNSIVDGITCILSALDADRSSTCAEDLWAYAKSSYDRDLVSVALLDMMSGAGEQLDFQAFLEYCPVQEQIVDRVEAELAAATTAAPASANGLTGSDDGLTGRDDGLTTSSSGLGSNAQPAAHHTSTLYPAIILLSIIQTFL